VPALDGLREILIPLIFKAFVGRNATIHEKYKENKFNFLREGPSLGSRFPVKTSPGQNVPRSKRPQLKSKRPQVKTSPGQDVPRSKRPQLKLEANNRIYQQKKGMLVSSH
jgi:hypothetical protein